MFLAEPAACVPTFLIACAIYSIASIFLYTEISSLCASLSYQKIRKVVCIFCCVRTEWTEWELIFIMREPVDWQLWPGTRKFATSEFKAFVLSLFSYWQECLPRSIMLSCREHLLLLISLAVLLSILTKIFEIDSLIGFWFRATTFWNNWLANFYKASSQAAKEEEEEEAAKFDKEYAIYRQTYNQFLRYVMAQHYIF